MDEHLLWRETSRELLHRCRIFDLYSSRREHPARTAEGSASFYLLQSPDWITTVPVLSAGGREIFVMVRQYRHGIDRVTTEFPAGLAEPGEAPEETARRELCEETGYVPGRIRSAGDLAAAPAFMDNRLHVFVAQDLERACEQSLDRHEVLDVVEIEAAELERLVGTGEFVNSVTVVSYYLYLRFREEGSKGADRNRTGA